MRFEKVVCGTDLSENSRYVLDFLKDYRDNIGEVILVRVVNLARFYGIVFGNVEEFVENERKNSEEKLKAIVSELKKEGIEARYTVVVGNPSDEITNIANIEKADLIVVGARGRSKIKRVLFGSVAEGVVRLSKIPVLVVKNRKMFDKILYVHYPLDYDENLVELLNKIMSLSKESEITHVVEPMLPPESTHKIFIKNYVAAENTLNELAEKLEADVKVNVDVGYPARCILQKSKNYSLIVLRAVKMTGTTDLILRHSKVSVLLLRR